MKIKNKLKGEIIYFVWQEFKAEHTMLKLAKAIDIPIATFHRYVKDEDYKHLEE